MRVCTVIPTNISELKEKANESRQQAAAKAGEGSFQLTAIFGGMLPSKGTTPGKKAPPARFLAVVVDLKKLTNSTHGASYRVDGPDTISVPHPDSKVIAALKKEFKDKKGGATPEDEERLALARQDVKAWTQLKEGNVITCSTFGKKDMLEKMNAFQAVVTLIGFEGKFTVDFGPSYECSTVVPKPNNNIPAYVTINRYYDFYNKASITLPGPEEQYGKTYLLYFDNTSSTDGEVMQRAYLPDSNPSSYYLKKDDGTEKSMLPMTLTQSQKDGHEYWINAMIFNQDTINKSFGIVDKELYSKIIPNHPIPLISCCSVNLDKTRSLDNSGHRIRNISCWVNSSKFFLREYLLQQCPQISFEHARKLLCDPTKNHCVISKNQTKNPCKLNEDNMDEYSNFCGDKVICVSFWTGDLETLQNQGCQWRVLTARFTDVVERCRIAEAGPEEGAKQMEGVSHYVIYAVMPFNARELMLYQNPTGLQDEESQTPKRERTEEEREPGAPKKSKKQREKK